MMSAGSLRIILDEGQPVAEHRPWSRVVVTVETWNALIEGLSGGAWTMLGLWGEIGAAHLALYEESSESVIVASLPCPDSRFPSVGRRHPPAQRLERTMADLVGLQAIGAPDYRPWLDHGRWPVRHPLGAATTPVGILPPYRFLPAEGESLHQIPVGPVHAGIIEPGHFRFTANGETIVRLEQRLGYVHKGIESLLSGAKIDQAARLVGRVSGDSTVAYVLAFAHAVEAATETVIPDRAHWLWH